MITSPKFQKNFLSTLSLSLYRDDRQTFESYAREAPHSATIDAHQSSHPLAKHHFRDDQQALKTAERNSATNQSQSRHSVFRE
jgi:hypothetical protein